MKRTHSLTIILLIVMISGYILESEAARVQFKGNKGKGRKNRNRNRNENENNSNKKTAESTSSSSGKKEQAQGYSSPHMETPVVDEVDDVMRVEDVTEEGNDKKNEGREGEGGGGGRDEEVVEDAEAQWVESLEKEMDDAINDIPDSYEEKEHEHVGVDVVHSHHTKKEDKQEGESHTQEFSRKRRRRRKVKKEKEERDQEKKEGEKEVSVSGMGGKNGLGTDDGSHRVVNHDVSKQWKSARDKNDIARVSTRFLSLRPCDHDIGFFCMGIVPGNGRIRQCLVNKKRQLHQACMKHLEETDRERYPCHDDLQKFCPHIEDPTSISAFFCYHKNRKGLSKGCLKKVRPIIKKAQRRLTGGPCLNDVFKYCRDVGEQEQTVACMMKKKLLLHPECLRFLEEEAESILNEVKKEKEGKGKGKEGKEE